jgi:hypothetical protein
MAYMFEYTGKALRILSTVNDIEVKVRAGNAATSGALYIT